MTEAVVETPVVEVVETVESNPVVDQALEQGWVPKEDWIASGKSEDEWRPAKEFVERGEIFKSLHQVKRELRQEKAARETLQRHNQFIFEKAYNQAVVDLRKEKRDAIRAEDFDRLEQIETEMDQLQDQHQKERQALAASQAAAVNVGVPAEFQSWMDRNSWYATDQDLKDYADATGLVYANRNPHLPPTQVLKHVETEVRKKFPEKFNIRRAAPNAVASPDRTSRQAKGADIVLNETEKEIMRTFVRSGVMTEAEYKSQLKKVKERD